MLFVPSIFRKVAVTTLFLLLTIESPVLVSVLLECRIWSNFCKVHIDRFYSFSLRPSG